MSASSTSKHQKDLLWPGMVAHACNCSYLEGGDQRSTKVKMLVRPVIPARSEA
jgi:hypothetical protein